MGKYYPENVLSDNRQQILQTIRNCAGLPLAISLIGGLNFKHENEWEHATQIIMRKDTFYTLPTYNYNLYKTFELGIDALDENERLLYQTLAVFKRVHIPKQSIMAIWHMNRHDTIGLLKKLNARSLLVYDERR